MVRLLRPSLCSQGDGDLRFWGGLRLLRPSLFSDRSSKGRIVRDMLEKNLDMILKTHLRAIASMRYMQNVGFSRHTVITMNVIFSSEQTQ